jgi:hypothetical protein
MRFVGRVAGFSAGQNLWLYIDQDEINYVLEDADEIF